MIVRHRHGRHSGTETTAGGSAECLPDRNALLRPRIVPVSYLDVQAQGSHRLDPSLVVLRPWVRPGGPEEGARGRPDGSLPHLGRRPTGRRRGVVMDRPALRSKPTTLRLGPAPSGVAETPGARGRLAEH